MVKRKTAKSTALATTAKAGVPAHLKQYQKVGASDIDIKDEIQIPYIKLVQKMSSEVDEGIAEYGDIINSSTKEVISNDDGSVNLIVVKQFINYKMFDPDTFAPLATGNTWKEFVDNAEAAGVEVEEQWKYKFYNFFVLIEGDNVPYILSLGKTSAKAGKKLINAINQQCFAKGLPIFGKVFTLFSQEVEGKNKKKYLEWRISAEESNYVDENMADVANALRESLDSREHVIAETHVEAEVEEAPVQKRGATKRRRAV